MHLMGVRTHVACGVVGVGCRSLVSAKRTGADKGARPSSRLVTYSGIHVQPPTITAYEKIVRPGLGAPFWEPRAESRGSRAESGRRLQG